MKANLPAILNNVIRPTLTALGPRYQSPEAEVMLLAIGLQESRFEHRQQIGGPARGFWQFEKGGGVRGVLTHNASRDPINDFVATCCYETPMSEIELYAVIQHHDGVACAAARLLLYTDAQPLPLLQHCGGAWNYYQRVWRPGKPHPDTWPDLHKAAVKAVQA